jgi:hypothetical protein
MLNDKVVVGQPVQFLLHGGEATPGAAVHGSPGTTFPGLIHAVFDDEVVNLDYNDSKGDKHKALAVVDVVFFDQNGHARREHGCFLLDQGAEPPSGGEAYCRYPAPPRKGDKALKTGTPGSAGQAAGTPPTTNSESTSTDNLAAPPGAQNPNNTQGKFGTVSIPKTSPDAVVPGAGNAAGTAGNAPASHAAAAANTGSATTTKPATK